MRLSTNSFVIFLWSVVTLLTASAALAQSSDQGLPTAVSSNEINGVINPLDLGDPRLTRHFYAFAANAGDLIITTESKNLNGDIDVFTAVTFRPLMKTTMYANTQMPEVTKSVFLRTHQILILRIEARTPNDEAGSYHIRFRGTFEPFSGGIPVAEVTESSSEPTQTARGTKRVSSVGATIIEPPAETSGKAEPAPSPAPESPAVAASTTKPASETKTETPKSVTPKTPPRSTARNSRRRPPPRAKAPATPKETAKTTLPKDESPAKTTEAVNKEENAGEAGKSGTENPKSSAKAEKPTQDVSQPVGARLIIEEKDGTRIDRPMSTIRRVVIEGSAIVIVMKTGRLERVPMSLVIRMAIEP